MKTCIIIEDKIKQKLQIGRQDLNDVRYNSREHSRTRRGSRGAIAPKFPRFGQNSKFLASEKKIFGQNRQQYEKFGQSQEV